MSTKLPPGARAFLRSPSGRKSRTIAIAFHRWLARKDVHLDVADVMPDHVWWFISVLGRSPNERYASTVEASRRWFALFPYLEWLWRGARLHFDPEVLRSAPPPPPVDRDPYAGATSDPHFLWCHQDWRPYCRRELDRAYHSAALLPDTVKRLQAVLAATHKPSTVRGYGTSLGRLHRFLASRSVSLATLSRRDIEDWCQLLHAHGLHAATRLQCLLHARSYLRWAHDEGIVATEPDLLLRRGDLPKLPQYLPRPLPTDLDRELQARLAGGGTAQLALLLMRRTGLRIGELLGLEHQCLRVDPKGRRYLKVPLGKLDTERLVPLDDDTLSLVRRLQAGPRRTYLLAGEDGNRPRYEIYRQALHDAAHGLEDTQPLTSHRLRHTYATELLAGGMSLPALMRVLGHRDHRMTLRYAAITDELVAKEYGDALAKLGSRYSTCAPPHGDDTSDAHTLLSDIARWVNTRAPARLKKSLLARIRRVMRDLDGLDPPT